MNASSIMRFEDLLEIWRDRHTHQSILEFLGIGSHGDVRGVEESDPGFMRILCERLDGTWWEVTWSCLPVRRATAENIRCRYLADSLKDAVRRCPGAQLPPQVSIDEVDDGLMDEELELPETIRGRHRSMAAQGDE